MRTITSRLAALLYGIALVFWAAAVASQPASELLPVVAQHNASSLARGSVSFQRGVFRIEEAGQRITLLCIPVKGVWKHVGSMRDCGNPPPPALQSEIFPFAPDMTVLGIRSLGITTEQWGMVQKLAGSGSPKNAFERVGRAFSVNLGANDLSWRLDSQQLPEELKTPVPGGAIAIHFGGQYSEERRPPLFEPDRDDLLIEARFALPTLVLSGKAHAGMTIAVNLDARTVRGNRVPVPVIVNLFHPNPGGLEIVRNDGRRFFVSSYLGPGNRYIQQVENRQRSTPWQGLEVVRFQDHA